MAKEDRERIKAKLRAEIEAQLLHNIDALVDKAYAAWEASEATQISSAVTATLGQKRQKAGAIRSVRKAPSGKGCRICGLAQRRARGEWAKPHTLEAHKKG